MDRAQAHTLEAFVAALLLIAGLIFAAQATAVTPLSASTSNQHIENQHRVAATDLLSTAHADGTLREAVVHWDTDREEFEGADHRGYYTRGGPETAFGKALNETFADERIAFNVELQYWDCADEKTDEEHCERDRQRMVRMGEPSDNAATATQTVTLFNETETADGTTLGEADEVPSRVFYAPNAGGESETLYNVVEVRITAWTM